MKTVIELAREADKPEETCWLAYEIDFLERFAALVIANHPPQSYMTWQEGYEAGKQAEREACAKLCDGLADMHAKMNQWGSHKTADTLAQAIRARSNT